MAAREDWCTNQISKLQVEDLRMPTLTEIKNYFASIPHEEAIRTANNLELSPVFDCLNDSNTEQVELACEVLSLCMSNLTLGDSTNRYGIPLERALNHPHSNVKIMALKEIQRNIADPNLLTELSKRSSLINSLLRRLTDEDLDVVKRASAILLRIGTSEGGISQMLSIHCHSTVYEVLTTNEVVRLRVSELLIDIARVSERAMLAMQSTGLLSLILLDLSSSDVLLKMNIIELISKLVTTKHGYSYLDSCGALNRIFKHFETNDPLMVQLCEPGILRLFGHMAHWRPIEMLAKYSVVVNKLFQNIQCDDLTLVGVSLDTLGHIAEKNEGKYALESLGNKLTETLKNISSRIASFPSEIRIRALNCLESLIRITDFDSRVTNLVRKWYSAMGDNPIEWMYKIAQNPFTETRLAGIGVLNAVALHNWGQEYLNNTPGFIEYLLDRRSETSKECKEAKHELAKTLSTSSAFDPSTLTRLQTFVKEGPFYVQAVTDVAVEGED